jgi:hypothetical protein
MCLNLGRRYNDMSDDDMILYSGFRTVLISSMAAPRRISVVGFGLSAMLNSGRYGGILALRHRQR